MASIENEASSDHPFLVGGFNPFEKLSQNWIISPGRVEKLKKKYLKPPPRFSGSFP